MSLWPFHRRQRQAPQPAAPTASATPVPAAAPQRPTGEWNLVPTLSTTSGPPPLVAPLSRIATGLASTADSGMVLAPLGHQRARDAPTGLVSGTLTPIAATAHGGRTTGPAMELRRPVQQRPEGSTPRLRWPQAATATAQPPLVAMEGSQPTAEYAAPSTPAAPPSPSPASAILLPQVAPPRRLTATPDVAKRKMGATPAMPVAAAPGQAVATPNQAAAPAPWPGSTTAPARPATPAAATPTNPPRPAPTTPTNTTPTVSVANEAAPSLGDTPAPLSGPRTIHRRRVGEPLTHRPATMVGAVSPVSELPTVTSAGRSSMGAHSTDNPVSARPAPATRDALPVRLARPGTVVAATASPPTESIRRPQRSAAPRPAPLVGRRAPLSDQQPTIDDRPAGPRDGALPVSVAHRRDARPAVVPISRPGPTAAHGHPPVAAPERVPADLSAQLEPMLGVSLSDVPVHRGAASSRAAAGMRARAYTSGAEVHLPEKLGPTSHGEARQTLAHELTHVAQQRRLGAVAPNEDSPAGAEMEAEARQVARRVSAPQRVSVAPPAPRRPTVVLSHGSTKASTSRAAQPSSSLSPTEQREMVGHIESSALSSGMATRMPGGGVAFGGAAPIAASAIGVQREPEQGDEPAPQTNRVVETSSESSQPDDLTPERIDELASRLYDGVRSRLRHDLLVQRERSGSLFDHR